MGQESFDGIELIVIPDPVVPTCRVDVGFAGGGRLDPPGCKGAHRAMAELLVRGTESKSRREFNRLLEQMGSSIAVAWAGDSIRFELDCLSRHLDASLRLLEEALIHPALDEEELVQLVAEIEDEIVSARDDEEFLAALWFQRAFFSGTEFAKRSAGELSDLPNLNVEVIRSLHRARLASDPLIVVAAGDIDRPVLEAFVERLTNRPMRRSNVGAASVHVREPEEPRILLVDQPEHEQVQLRLGRLGLSGRDPRLVPFWLGTTAFGETFTSPFVQAVRDERGWSYTAHVAFTRYGTLPAYWIMESVPALEDALECLALEVEMYRDLAQGKLPDEAIALGRSYLLNHFPLTVASVRDRVYPAFRNALLGSDALESERTLDAIRSTSDDQVRDAMRHGLHRERWAAVMVGSVAQLAPKLAERFAGTRIAVVDYRSNTLSPFEELLEEDP